MKNTIIILCLLLFFSTINFASGKKVLVEIFTNSDCGNCVAAHYALESYLTGPNADNIEYIYYHIEWPSPLDQLYTYNVGDSKSKNLYYGPYFASPQAFFNGQHVENSYSQWTGLLDNMASTESDFQLELTGSKKSTSYTINADVTKIVENNINDLAINFVIVENVHYEGVNGIKDHKHVMRKIKKVEGTLFTANLNETTRLSAVFPVNSSWNEENLKVVVFLQSQSTKEIYQSASIDPINLTVTDVNLEESLSSNFKLGQNYPNPFNPTTTINYTIPLSVKMQNSLPTGGHVASVQLKIFDVLGREVATLVSKNQAPGTYSITFDATNFNSGIYYYQLQYNGLVKTKTMTLIK